MFQCGNIKRVLNVPKSILSLSILLMAASVGSATDKGFKIKPALLWAIAEVESGGDCNAIGDKGKAVGCLQIWPITVKDANRIIGQDKYTLKDRYSKEKSFEICRIILLHYEKTPEAMARRWNGGSNWKQKPTTIKYWNKVKKAMK